MYQLLPMSFIINGFTLVTLWHFIFFYVLISFQPEYLVKNLDYLPDNTYQYLPVLILDLNIIILFQMSYNPQWYGFAAANDKQISGGSAPFVYNYLPHDGQTCITAKSLFNTVHSAIYTPDRSIPSSHPAASIIQGVTLTRHENAIQNECNPTFKIDTTIDYNSLGVPSPSFSGFS